MVCENRTELKNYIIKFKGTFDLHEPYREFKFSWLGSFEKNLEKNVKINFDCLKNERIWGDGDYDEYVLNDFIESLENLLK